MATSNPKGTRKTGKKRARAEERVMQKRANLKTDLMKAHADLAVRDPRFKIAYLIPHYPQDLNTQSTFGWYTPALHKAASPLIMAATLPADIRELTAPRESILLLRLTRRIWPMLVPVDLNAIQASINLIETPFKVFLSTDEAIANEIDTLILRSTWPCLHISTAHGKGRILQSQFCLEILMNYCRTVLGALAANEAWSDFVAIAKAEVLGKRQTGLKIHPLKSGEHNVTTPNESALKALGWVLRAADPISEPVSEFVPNAERYVNRICQSAKAVSAARSLLMKRMSPQLIDYRYILAMQSLYWGHFSNFRQQLANLEQAGIHAESLKFAFKQVVRATTYFDVLDENNIEVLNAPAFRYIHGQRALDAYSFTSGLTILAAATLAPVLRLEPKLNQVRGDLKQLANCARSNSPYNFDLKISRLARNASRKMRTLVHPSLLARIDAPEKFRLIEGLKLVTDLPLELMYSGGLPLSMRFDISRMPVLPGNLFLKNCIRPPVIVPLEKFSEILVIRSFEPNDRLKYMLEKAISLILSEAPSPRALKVSVRFVDALNEDELVTALHSFGGAIMIFDGHGSYDGEIGSGTIVIGGKAIDTWRLREKCTLPPIVIFSACDTQPMDGSHSSVATAAFSLDAQAVLATTLPIDGRKAAIFIGRLIFRITEFLPLAVEQNANLTWRDVISGMLRMCHVSEIMNLLERHAGAAYQSADYESAQLEANVAINERRSSWYDEFVGKLSFLVQKPMAEVKRDIDVWASMTDSMKYIQLGNPENIRIVKESPADVFQREMAATARAAP